MYSNEKENKSTEIENEKKIIKITEKQYKTKLTVEWFIIDMFFILYKWGLIGKIR